MVLATLVREYEDPKKQFEIYGLVAEAIKMKNWDRVIALEQELEDLDYHLDDQGFVEERTAEFLAPWIEQHSAEEWETVCDALMFIEMRKGSFDELKISVEELKDAQDLFLALYKTKRQE